MCGLRGLEATQLKSQTIKIPKVRTLAETYSSKDTSLGNKVEGSLFFDEAVR
jgi:hypothetical protein